MGRGVPGVRFQRVVKEEILAREALAGHHVGDGTEIHHVERILRGGRLPLLSQRKVQADGFLETAGPVEAVGPGQDLVGGKPGGRKGHGDGHRCVHDVLGPQGKPRRDQEKYDRKDALHLLIAYKITNLFGQSREKGQKFLKSEKISKFAAYFAVVSIDTASNFDKIIYKT